MPGTSPFMCNYDNCNGYLETRQYKTHDMRRADNDILYVPGSPREMWSVVCSRPVCVRPRRDYASAEAAQQDVPLLSASRDLRAPEPPKWQY